MKTSELIKKIAVETNLTQAQVKIVLNNLGYCIGTALNNNDKLDMKGVGIFSVIETSERKGRNPSTGEEVTIKPGKRIKFKASKSLKDLLV